MGKAAKLSKRMVDGTSQPHEWAIQVLVAEGFLEKGEETPGARQSQGHGSELAEDLVPSLGGDVTCRARDVQDVVETVDAMRRELNGATDGINSPAKHDLPG